jgi:AraC-like DNA-binding protein/mannose-6-phosphate isomerase-like protein (cupin superfamily)
MDKEKNKYILEKYENDYSANSLNLYEKKILSDKEFPVDVFINQIKNKGTIYHPHWHEHIELHYFLRGEGHVFCNHKRMKVGRGNLVVYNGNELHEGICDTVPLEAIVIIFELNEFSKEFSQGNVIFENLIESDNTIQQLCVEIYQESVNKLEGYKLAAKGRIYQLISHMIRNYTVMRLTDSENKKRNKNLSRLNTVIQYIKKHYTEPISNQELAALIHLSEDRFNHMFKESMGKSPQSFINEVRLQAARNFLRQENLSITEISGAVGFPDLNNFGRQFQRYYGMTPSKFRKENVTQSGIIPF